MTKSVQLKLSKIKYIGDSIGDDIRVDIEVLGKFLRVDRNIKAGTTVVINQEIGRFETDRGAFYADVSITVLEKDLLFNDVGSTKGSLKVNTGIIKPQQFVFEVQMGETSSIFGKSRGGKIADFEIILEAIVMDAVRYIPNDDIGKGWLTVRIEDSRSNESLPAYTKVKLEYSNGKREYFIPLEGVYRGKLVSARLQENGSSNLISDIRYEPVALALYSISKKSITINGKAYATVDFKNAPLNKGLYDIEIPDYPHPGGTRYEKDASRAKTWFKIGHSGERYLHTGSRSLGCITIVETKRWMEIYNVLIRARKDSVSVGVLEVID